MTTLANHNARRRSNEPSVAQSTCTCCGCEARETAYGQVASGFFFVSFLIGQGRSASQCNQNTGAFELRLCFYEFVFFFFECNNK